MFKKLEEVDLKKVRASDSTPEAECICSCSSPQSKKNDTEPEALKSGNSLSIYFDING